MSSNNLGFIFLVLIIFFRCKNDTKISTDNNDLIIVDPKISEKSIRLDQIIASLEFIPLLENKSALITDIQKLIEAPDHFIIKCFDREAIYFYNKHGAYIKKLIPEGSGPLEFTTSSDLSLSGNILYICDSQLNKILKYDLELGKFIQEWSSKQFPIFSIYSYTNSLYVISNDPVSGHIKILDTSNFTPIYSYVTSPISFNAIISPRPFQSFSGSLYINVGFTDTLYRVTNHSIKPYLVFGQNKTSLSSLDLTNYVNQLMSHVKVNTEAIIPMGLFSITDHIWTIGLMSPTWILLWDQFSNTSKMVKHENIEHFDLIQNSKYFDILSYNEFSNYSYCSNMMDEIFYSAAENYLSDTTNTFYNEVYELINAYPRKASYQNPLIIKFKMKRDFMKFL